MYSQDIYRKALDFAATAHGEQIFPGKPYSYVVHITAVAMEVIFACNQEPELDINLAINCALLHDVVEDTPHTGEEVEQTFGTAVAEGVLALSKDMTLPKEEQLKDSLERIRRQPYAVWAVKLADRISNLEEPPHYWKTPQIAAYLKEAQLILESLGEASPYLAARLEHRIEGYSNYL